MIYKPAIFLLLILMCLGSFAQTRLKGDYNLRSREFVSADAGVLIKQFENGLAPFMIKGENPFNYKSNHVGFIDTTGRIVIKPVFSNCSFFNGEFALVQDTLQRFAMINRKGRIIIPFLEGTITLCGNGLLILKKHSEKEGISIVNNRGEVIVPFGRYLDYAAPPQRKPMFMGFFDDQFHWNPSYFKTSVPFKEYIGVKKDTMWAVVDRKGKEIVPPGFDWIGTYQNEIVPVMKNGKYGVSDTAGRELVPALYENIVLNRGNFVIATKNKKSGVLSISNKLLIPLNYGLVFQINDNAFLVDTGGVVDSYGNHRGSKYGVINTSNKLILPLSYSHIDKFGNTYLVQKYRDSTYTRSNYDKSAIFDSDGIQKTGYESGFLQYPVFNMGEEKGSLVYNEDKHEFIHYERVDGLIYYRDKKCGLLDSSGAEVTKAQYDKYYYIQFKKAIVVQKDNKWGIIDFKGKVLLPAEYDKIDRLDEEISIVKKENKYGLTDRNFRIISPVKYDEIYLEDYRHQYYNNLRVNIPAMVNHKWGYLNMEGKEVTAFKYDDKIWAKTADLSQVMIDHKYGLINNDGVEIVPCIYDDLDFNRSTLIIAGKDGHFGLINKKGKIVMPVVFKRIMIDRLNYKDAYVITYKDKMGVSDESGKLIVPMIYDSCSICGKETILVEKDHLFGAIDDNGKIIYPCKYTHIGCADGKITVVY